LPADRPKPFSPTIVASPSGRSFTNSVALARWSARATASGSASGRASRTLSAMLAGASQGSCGTQASSDRHTSGSTSSRSSCPAGPSRMTRPVVGATNRSSTHSRVVFPQPLGPATPT
jgi:hypothetical protein